MFDWIKERLAERSTHEGAIVAVAAAAILFANYPLMKVVLVAALVWGVYQVIRSEW
jgi:hypothetical protein